MARLILLGGAPGVGKSTVARRYADARPDALVLVLDVDLVRSLVGRGGHVTASRLAARDLAVAMADVHLRAGHDVVVPQYLGRPEFLDRLAATAARAGATFVEVVLLTDRAAGRARFDARGAVPQLAGADDDWEQMHARLTRLLGSRPDARTVDASGDVDATLAAVEAVLAVDPGAGPGR